MAGDSTAIWRMGGILRTMPESAKKISNDARVHLGQLIEKSRSTILGLREYSAYEICRRSISEHEAEIQRLESMLADGELWERTQRKPILVTFVSAGFQGHPLEAKKDPIF
jgi:hypothetical protein